MEEETPKTRSRRIRRSLIHLPVALFGKMGKQALKRSGGKGLMLAAAGLVAGGAYLASAYSEKKEEEKPGEKTPDFEDDDDKDLDEDKEVSEDEPEDVDKSEVQVKKEIVPKPVDQPQAVAAPVVPIRKPPEAKSEEKSMMDKIKGLFSSEKATEPKPGLSTGKIFTSKLGKKLDQGYRVHFEFSGFNSAKALSKYGAYTKQEADTIILLKSNGTNTSANAGKMSVDIEERIRFYAKKHGFSEDAALKMAQIESGGNPNAVSATGAIGIYQFTGRTASEAGITDRFDVDQNIEAGIIMAKKNMKKLQEADLPMTATNVYLMHQLGVSGARELLRAAEKGLDISTLSKTTQNAIKHNFGASTAKTAKDYIRQTEIALDARSTSDRFASSSEVAPAVAAVSTASVVAPVKVPAEAAMEMPKSSTKPVPIVIAKDQSPEAKPAKEEAKQTQQVVRQTSGSDEQVSAKPQALVKTKHGIVLAV